MSSTTFIQGLSRVLNCSKVHVAVTGLVTTWFAVHYVTADLPPTQRASLWVAFIGAVTVQLREIINAWTEEDVAGMGERKIDAATRRQGDAGSKSEAGVVVAESSRRLPVSASASPLPPSHPTTPCTERSPDMPHRTKLPFILVVSTLVVLASAGCQPSPELAIYREGLHGVDEPLYQAHLLVIDDAVKAGIRSDADRQVVQQGINAARGLYQQSQK